MHHALDIDIDEGPEVKLASFVNLGNNDTRQKIPI